MLIIVIARIFCQAKKKIKNKKVFKIETKRNIKGTRNQKVREYKEY